jgi:hypothetical protein
VRKSWIFEPGPVVDTAIRKRWAEPPVKVDGRHRWVATVMHTLSDGQASAHRAGSQITLDLENLSYVAVGCIDCEAPIEAAWGTRCPAGDEWRRP